MNGLGGKILQSFSEQMSYTIHADIFKEHPKIIQMLCSLTQSDHSLNKRGNSKMLHSIPDKRLHKLAIILKSILINIIHKRIHQLLQMHNDPINNRHTVIPVGFRGAYSQHHVHRLVDVREEGLLVVFA